MPGRLSLLRCLLLLLPLVALAGCVKETTEGATHTFAYEWWVSLSLLVGGIVAAPAGWYLRESAGRLGWVLLIAGPLAAILGAPSMFLDRVTVTDEGIARQSGFWGMSAVQNLKFAEINRVLLTSEETRGRRGRKSTNYYVVCELKNGSSEKMPFGNQLVEAAMPTIAAKLHDHGIEVNDETGQ